ncbi:undecaprenyl/decaprenyl-phosphate alpha-N-acetylglucosaminyl 1-phosphate transferase [Streptomyces sp. SID5910]|nr:undecaprenyl/decaprenyl-phosphate alpha-N-acetylglucosaminyl 1-phosphate transferase [Streptomyces sp. SID5910]
MLYGITAATASFLLAALLTALLRASALRLALVDRRRARPVPLLGGVAVVLVTGLVAGSCQWAGVVPLGTGVVRLLVAGCAVGALGLAADLWRLRRRWLLAGTAVAAACVVPYDVTGVPAGVLAVVWIALAATAFRGLDHADGLAGTVGVVTAFGIGVCAAAELMDGLAVLLSVLAAALAGFLLHNWHPARIALGASGSLFAGFLLAGSAVFTRAGQAPGAGAGVLFALTALVSADAVLVLLSRRLAGRPPLRGGPDHLAHRLRRLGVTPQGVVVLLGVGAFCGVLVGVLVHVGRVGETAVLWVAGAFAAVVLGLLRVRVYEPRRTGPDTAVRASASARRRVPSSRPGTEGRATPRPSPGASPRASVRRADFPVRQASGPEEAQVKAPLRVRNG